MMSLHHTLETDKEQLVTELAEIIVGEEDQSMTFRQQLYMKLIITLSSR